MIDYLNLGDPKPPQLNRHSSTAAERTQKLVFSKTPKVLGVVMDIAVTAP